MPVRWDERYVGLKLGGDGYGFGENDPVEVNAILVGRDGALAAGDLEWRLVEEDYWFDWYREDGEWRWRRSFKDILVADAEGLPSWLETATPENVPLYERLGFVTQVEWDVPGGPHFWGMMRPAR